MKEIEKEVQCLGYYLMIMLMVGDLLKSDAFFFAKILNNDMMLSLLS